MAKTRNERRMKAAERRAFGGVILLIAITVILWFATLRAFAMAAC